MHKSGRAGRVAVILGAITLLFSSNVQAAPTPPLRPQGDNPPHDLVSLRLNASKHVYANGEPVLIQVSVINRSAQTVRVAKVTPWEAATLVVVREGQPVAPSGTGSGVRNRTPVNADLLPGQSWIYVAYPEAEPYNAISNWGYWKLPTGHYTIFATPALAPVKTTSSKHWTLASRQSRSNAIDIDIAP